MEHEQLTAALRTHYRLEGRLSSLGGHGRNFRLDTETRGAFAVKVADASVPVAHLELEDRAAAALAESALVVPVPVPTDSGVPWADLTGGGRLRVLRWVDGMAWGQASPPGTDRLRALGALVAEVTTVLAPVDPPAARRTHAWDLAAAGAHRGHLHRIADPARRALAAAALERWAACAPELATVPRGLIHGDLNDENVLVDGQAIVGVLDLGDALDNPWVCELAIAMAYALLPLEDPWTTGAEIVAGHHARRPLSATEVELLYPLVCARLAVSVIESAGRRASEPDREAWFVSEAGAWTFLERFGQEDPVSAADRWARAIGVRPWPDRGAGAEALRTRRTAHVSGALSLTYREPVAFVRGRGSYLMDHRGRPFLDLYNNVAHVGHCHPRVVEAGQRQMARLNTNTRYLLDAHVAYAERLAGTFPPELDTVFLVNSGTEANELALRLARTHTGRHDVVVLDHAYHGHSAGLVEVSPYKFMGPGGSGAPVPWVHLAPQPDGFRGSIRGHDRAAGTAYGDAVGETVERAMAAAAARAPGVPGAGGGVAAFLAETLPSVGGQIIPPPGYFETAFAHVRAAGGVCILDEVQVGLGRVGSSFWAFQDYGVVPDIVVLGKPLGNGHPMGAVVCTGEVAASFDNGMEFFSTFGGNPVSCAIGSAVLDAVAEDGLQAHAAEAGAHLLAGLRQVAARHSAIGEVRGRGLFAGIELVGADGVTPAPALAADVVNALRQQRILTGTDGPHENVIKLKGPLVVGHPELDRFVDVLDEVLAAAGG